MTKMIKPKVVVFASSMFAQHVLGVLAQQQCLAGVVLPDPAEVCEHAAEISAVALQLQNAAIPYQYCCKAKLSLIHQQLKAWGINVGMIAGYPHILPRELLGFFSVPESLGLYNLHASRLPEYPGPQPLYWQIRNTETETALVLHHAQIKADSGDIVAKQIVKIGHQDTLPSLTNRIALASGKLTSDWLEALITEGKQLVGRPQMPLENSQSQSLTGREYAHRPQMSDLSINFEHMNAQQIGVMCRAGNASSLAATANIKGIPVSVLQATPVDQPTYGTKAGTIVFIGEPEGLIVCVKDGALSLDILACSEGVFTGLTFAEYFQLDAGNKLIPASFSSLQQQYA